jgi:hypothetical protein
MVPGRRCNGVGAVDAEGGVEGSDAYSSYRGWDGGRWGKEEEKEEESCWRSGVIRFVADSYLLCTRINMKYLAFPLISVTLTFPPQSSSPSSI